MKLEDCTKAELIAIIRRRCLREEEIEREVMLIRCDKAAEDMRKAGEAAVELLQEYTQLLRPYEGRKFSEIPGSVIEKAKDILDKRERCLDLENGAQARYNKADKRWRELAGL